MSEALKGRSCIAQGDALGKISRVLTQALKGRENVCYARHPWHNPSLTF